MYLKTETKTHYVYIKDYNNKLNYKDFISFEIKHLFTKKHTPSLLINLNKICLQFFFNFQRYYLVTR